MPIRMDKAIVIGRGEQYPPPGFEGWKVFRIGQALMGNRFDQVAFTMEAVRGILLDQTQPEITQTRRWIEEELRLKFVPKAPQKPA